MTEREVLAKYSNPRLRLNELTRREKKEHLASLGVKGEAAEKILDELYPEEQDEPKPPSRSKP
jgi:hypothetical protein